ncbi:MAG: hypothetical protein ACKPGW_23030 [Microcystis panniformis]
MVDEKLKVKVGIFSCAMCHTRVMGNGQTIKGAQGTFPMDKRDGIDAENEFKSLSKENLQQFNEGMRKGRMSLQKAPWINLK